jgi:REP element-mobilizing transposase RayT
VRVTDGSQLWLYRRDVARAPRDERPGFHHVVTRGNNRRSIYVSDRDRNVFFLMVDRLAKKHGWSVIAYCLMGSHYHLILHVGTRGLARGMDELNGGYARWFNGEHGRTNHLFGKRYWNRPLRTEATLMNGVRYVIQNPQRAGVPGPLESHRWTSYAPTIGLDLPHVTFDPEHVLQIFSDSPASAIVEFKRFCAERVLPDHDGRQPS